MDATAWTFAKWGSSLNWFWNSNYTVFQQSHLLLNFHSDLICPYRIGWKCHKRWNWTKSVCNYLRAPVFSISLSSKIKYNYFHFKQFCFLHLFWILGYRLCPSVSTSRSCRHFASFNHQWGTEHFAIFEVLGSSERSKHNILRC